MIDMSENRHSLKIDFAKKSPVWPPPSFGDHFPTRIMNDVLGCLLHCFLLQSSTTFLVNDEKVHEEQKEYVIIITPNKEQLPPPLAAKVLASVERALASLQDDPEPLILRVPCMIQEVHEEEEEHTSVSATLKEQPSLSPTVGEAITLVGRNLVALQDVPKYQLIQGLQKFPSHIISAP